MPKFARIKQFEQHDFYCMNCGKRATTLFRSKGRLREISHKKKLYCPYCRVEVNHIECRTQDDVWKFQEAFKNGEFVEEAKASIEYVKENG